MDEAGCAIEIIEGQIGGWVAQIDRVVVVSSLIPRWGGGRRVVVLIPGGWQPEGWTSGTDLTGQGGNRAEGILPHVPWRFQRHPQLSELPLGGARVGPLT